MKKIVQKFARFSVALLMVTSLLPTATLTNSVYARPAEYTGTEKDTGSSSSSSSSSIDAARKACEAKGGRFDVTNGGSSGFTTTCTVNGETTYTNVDNNSSSNSGSDTNSGAGGGSSSSSSDSSDSGPTFASPGDTSTSNSANAAILTGCAGVEAGNGEGIKCVVLLVVNIMSVLVGILGVIGIVVVGLQYLTAGGNEEQTRKAKRRLFEIVIGIILYVLIAALLNWLLPNFNPTTNSTSTSLVPTIIASIGA